MNRLTGALAAGLIVSLAGSVRAQEAPATPDGAALYRQNCRSCHGATGTPSERMRQLYKNLRPLSDSTVLASLTVDSIVTVLVNGKGDKKPFGDKLSRDEMVAVANYVMTLGRPAGP